MDFVGGFFHSFFLILLLLLFIYLFIFLLYNSVLVLPYINMHPPRVYTCSPFWTPLPPPFPYHPSGSSHLCFILLKLCLLYLSFITLAFHASCVSWFCKFKSIKSMYTFWIMQIHFTTVTQCVRQTLGWLTMMPASWDQV